MRTITMLYPLDRVGIEQAYPSKPERKSKEKKVSKNVLFKTF